MSYERDFIFDFTEEHQVMEYLRRYERYPPMQYFNVRVGMERSKYVERLFKAITVLDREEITFRPMKVKLTLDLRLPFSNELLEKIKAGYSAEDIIPEIKKYNIKMIEAIVDEILGNLSKEVKMTEGFRRMLREWLKVLVYVIAKNIEESKIGW